jgi:oxaloacetate decarboxylase gamma subunit
MLFAARFSLDNITTRELVIALMGMLIVFTALLLITAFIAILPKALKSLNHLLPPETDHHHVSVAPASASVDEAVVVAIAVGLHARTQSKSTE